MFKATEHGAYYVKIEEEKTPDICEDYRGRWTLSVQEGFDVPDVEGMAELTVGGGAETVGAHRDWSSHWLKVTLEEGQEYRLQAKGSDGDDGADDPDIWGVFTAEGDVLNGTLSGFKGDDASVQFVAPEDDEYYVMVWADPYEPTYWLDPKLVPSTAGTMDVSIEEV